MKLPYRLLLPLALLIIISSYFTATQPITPGLAIVSGLFVLLFAAPSYGAVLSAIGLPKGLRLLAALGIFALAIETSAIHTGFPYGDFVYADLLGQKIAGLTPWTVAFAYPPILLLGYYCARRYFAGGWKLYAGAAALTMAVDLVLDPAAVALGFWYWHTPGFYYGVPVVNFLGWLLSGFAGAVLLHGLWPKSSSPPSSIAYSGLLILGFWTSVNIWLGSALPSLIGIALLLVFSRWSIPKKTNNGRQPPV
jgi:bisanhydrobacterioruberin hydratase